MSEFKNAYLAKVYENVVKRDPDQPEFLQTVKEVLESFEPIPEKKPEIEKSGVIERIVEPERMIIFENKPDRNNSFPKRLIF